MAVVAETVAELGTEVEAEAAKGAPPRCGAWSRAGSY